jgi:hypothetical protein
VAGAAVDDPVDDPVDGTATDAFVAAVGDATAEETAVLLPALPTGSDWHAATRTSAAAPASTPAKNRVLPISAPLLPNLITVRLAEGAPLRPTETAGNARVRRTVTTLVSDISVVTVTIGATRRLPAFEDDSLG